MGRRCTLPAYVQLLVGAALLLVHLCPVMGCNQVCKVLQVWCNPPALPLYQRLQDNAPTEWDAGWGICPSSCRPADLSAMVLVSA
jgi:hypothetical protein